MTTNDPSQYQTNDNYINHLVFLIQHKTNVMKTFSKIIQLLTKRSRNRFIQKAKMNGT